MQAAPWEMMEIEEGAQQQQQHGGFVQPIGTRGDTAKMATDPQGITTGNTQLLASIHDQVRHYIKSPCPCYVAVTGKHLLLY